MDIWNTNWKYEAFLGIACDITLRYDERYYSFKKAINMVNPEAPASLLFLLAKCYISPGTPPISQEEAEKLLLESFEKEKHLKVQCL